jgi:hypothetical protein
MLMIQNKSILDHKHKLEKARLAKLKKQRELGDVVKNILATIAVLASFAGAYWLFNTGII